MRVSEALQRNPTRHKELIEQLRTQDPWALALHLATLLLPLPRDVQDGAVGHVREMSRRDRERRRGVATMKKYDRLSALMKKRRPTAKETAEIRRLNAELDRYEARQEKKRGQHGPGSAKEGDGR